MSTTAEKLTYLNTTKGKIKDSINLTGAGITSSDTFRSYATKLKQGLINALNDNGETIISNFLKVSGKGSNLSLTPTYEAPMGISVYGDTYQNGTPTPSSPIPINNATGLQNVNVCGKNLCFNITKPSNANLKFFINKLISKTFTISFTTNEALNGNSLYLEVDGTSYGNIGGITASANTKVEKTYTLSDTNYQAIENGTNIDLLLYKNGANFNIPNDAMVENNSTATSYEPYTGSTYEVNLGNIELNKIENYQDSIKKSTGKNLLNAGNGRLGTFSGLTISYSNGDILLNGTASSSVDFYVGTSVSTPTYNEELVNYMNTNLGTYTLSNNLGFENYFRIGGSYPQNTGTTTSTNKVDLIFVRIPAGTYNNKILNIMLNEGSTALPYEPYGKVWFITKNIGKVVLDGSENWTYNDVNQVFIVPDLVNYLRSGFVPYSNYYQGQSVTLYNQVENNHIAFLQSTTQNRLLIKNLDYTGVSTFKTWLSSNNVSVIYILNTPTYTTITNEELIKELESIKSKNGTTNISVSSEYLPAILGCIALKVEE